MKEPENVPDNNAGRKTPEEIKCGMECIRTNAERICVKPEKGQCPRCEQIVKDHINLIHYLESRLVQTERERDAAVADLEDDGDCRYCQRKDLPKQCGRRYCSGCENKECPCYDCTPKNNNFIWRGVCPANTKEESE